MKILTSHTAFQSHSQSVHQTEETVYHFDEDGQFIDKTRQTRTETTSMSAAAAVSTEQDYTVDFRHKETDGSVHTKNSTDDLLYRDDDFGLKLYTGSVLDWAADTIDRFVSAFETKARQDWVENRGRLQGQSGNLESAEAAFDEKIRFYRDLASEFRAKADALMPELPEAAAGEIRRTVHTERQDTIVRAGGMVKTADGREIAFSLDVGMHREASLKATEVVRLIDPLVINFSGDSARLSDDTFAFDLDGDGTRENIPGLSSNSGFLSLDINGDGKINSGRELFGPSTGSGFGELALYDGDNNMWIDENDPIYDRLSVWMRSGSGEDVLVKLSEAGIGAIHLGAVDSGFLLKDGGGETLGKITGTGVALAEDGTAVSIQQVDLVV